MSSLGGDGTGGGSDQEPFGGTADAAPGAATARDAQSIIAFVRESGGLLALVGEVALGGGELRLAGFAVDGEVVERFQILGGGDRIGFLGLGGLEDGGGLQEARGW